MKDNDDDDSHEGLSFERGRVCNHEALGDKVAECTCRNGSNLR